MMRNVLLIVLDGFSPVLVNAMTPRIRELQKGGVTFSHHHAVFPTVTRVNSASIATGCLPERHGLVENFLYLPELIPGETIDTGSHVKLRVINRLTGGNLLEVPTLTQSVTNAGMTVAVVTSSSSGACFLQNPEGVGLTVNPAFQCPEGTEVLDRFGPPPSKECPGERLNEWITVIMTEHVIPELKPNLGVIWFCDPDNTQHEFGLGAAESQMAACIVDRCVGRVIDAVHKSGADDYTNIIIMSDHGWISHSAPLQVAEALSAAGLGDDVVIAGQGVYQNNGTDLPDIVDCLISVEGMGALFTREGLPGSLPYDLIGYDHHRSPDVLFTSAWNGEENSFGVPGTARGYGVGGHGGASSYEIRSMMAASGPDFHRGLVSEIPSGHLDLYPTIRHLLRLPHEPGRDGRLLREALADGVDSGELEVMSQTNRSDAGPHHTLVQQSRVEDTWYMDYAARL